MGKGNTKDEEMNKNGKGRSEEMKGLGKSEEAKEKGKSEQANGKGKSEEAKEKVKGNEISEARKKRGKGWKDGQHHTSPMTKKKKALLKWRLMLFLLSAILSGWYWLGQKQAQPGDKQYGDLDPNAVERTTDVSMERPLTLDIPGYPAEILLEAGSETAPIDLHNPGTNTAYLQFELVIGRTEGKQFIAEEVLYESNLIQPGFSVASQVLSRPLEAGSYDAVINITGYTFHPETKEVQGLNSVQNRTRLEVK